MKKIYLFVFLLIPFFCAADELTNILNGNYKPQLLTAEQQDSILSAETVPAKGEAVSKPRWRLEYENKKPIYRHSFLADWYVVDTQKGTRTQVGDGPVRDAKMSPNGKYVVYAKDNNLYIFKLDYMTEVPITTNNGERTMIGGNGSYKERFIYNGISDWLYEEEFGVTSLFEFSPDSKQIAFVRLNETDVPAFTYQEVLNGNYPENHTIRYPRAGQLNARATVMVYDIYYKSTHAMTLNTDDCYIPRLTWTQPVEDAKNPVEAKLIVQKVFRDQNKMEIHIVNPKSTAAFLLYKESSDKYYVDYSLFDQWKWLKGDQFVVLSEKDGWSSAYLYSAQGQEMKRLTPDGIDVTCIYGVDEKAGILYYQAAPSPLVRHCYSCDMKKGVITKMSSKEGINKMRFSSDWQHAIAEYESNETPNIYFLQENKKGAFFTVRELLNNDSLMSEWVESGLPEKKFVTIATGRGDNLNAWIILPSELQNKSEERTDSVSATDSAVVEEAKKYPCVLMQYSGPGSQQVLNRWRKGFGHYLASQGYVVINSDGRGTGCRGRAWRNETYMNLGQKEAEDQLLTAQYAASLPFVDPKRIAIIGWSYGGFQAIRTLCDKENKKIIKSAVAIAPVTDWRMYDSGYTERFMRRPQVNEKGYDNSDLSKMANRMNGRLLLIHGLADDNVHAQHTLKFADALVQAGKQFEMQIYPDDNHFLRKRSNYEHLHRRIMLFLKRNL